MDGDDSERTVEEEIEKLTSEIENIRTAIEELGKAKEQTESKLKDEIKKAREIYKWKTQRINRNNSQTLHLLKVLSSLYDEMFCMHRNCELNDKTQDVMESYSNEFDALIKLYEKMAAGFLKPPQKRFGCPCQMDPEEYNNHCNAMNANIDEHFESMDKNYFGSFLHKKCSCPSHIEELEEEERDESIETFEA